MSTYLDCSDRDDVLSGGSRMIPVRTPAGTFRVWVKRVGNNPGLRVLLLHDTQYPLRDRLCGRRQKPTD